MMLSSCMNTNNGSLSEHNDSAIKMLPVDFTPGIEHVVISKGKKYCKHSGNLNLRNIVQSKLSLYLNANSKASKSAIIASVMKHIGASGGFVQVDKNTGLWVEASEYLAREKTSQAFRDELRHYYKSSRQNKRKNKPTLNTEPLWGIMESQRQHKRQRTQKATPAASLEFPTLQSSSSSSSTSLTSTPFIKEENDLCSRIFSLVCNELVHDIDTDPFEPTPIVEHLVAEPISLDMMMSRKNQAVFQPTTNMMDCFNVLQPLPSDFGTANELKRVISQ